MSEIAVSGGSNGSNSSSLGSSKRKRRSSIDETDIENKRPPVKKTCTQTDDVCLSDLDACLLASPNALNILSKSENGVLKSQYAISAISHSNNNNNNTGSGNVTIGSSVSNAEMTPQSLIKSDATWASTCTKCCRSQSTNQRLCPLPVLSWGDAKDVWRFMCKKDEKASFERDAKMLQNHPGLQPRMRAILLDWLIEVCEVYKLHRETYYLALDYLDRYLSTHKSVSKTYLQLIGISCLFIAAKVEEIYPPKISEFAYVTDGACREEDILRQELIILTTLKWQISPVTIVGWLSVYMQLNVTKRLSKQNQRDGPETQSKRYDADDAFVLPQFSGMEYAQTAQLLDLCTLDIGIADFSYSVIAAAAISHTFNKKTAIKLSGLDWATISPCSRWMEPFFRTCVTSPRLCLLESNDQVSHKHGLGHVCPNITSDDSHIIQMHTTSMEMFDEAMIYKEQINQEASPAQSRLDSDHVCPPDGLLTPPATNRKMIEKLPDSSCK